MVSAATYTCLFYQHYLSCKKNKHKQKHKEKNPACEVPGICITKWTAAQIQLLWSGTGFGRRRIILLLWLMLSHDADSTAVIRHKDSHASPILKNTTLNSITKKKKKRHLKKVPNSYSDNATNYLNVTIHFTANLHARSDLTLRLAEHCLTGRLMISWRHWKSIQQNCPVIAIVGHLLLMAECYRSSFFPPQQNEITSLRHTNGRLFALISECVLWKKKKIMGYFVCWWE